MRTRISKLGRIVIVGWALLLGPLVVTATAQEREPERYEGRRGMDWGWVGLLGLAGLAGLMGRERTAYRSNPPAPTRT